MNEFEKALIKNTPFANFAIQEASYIGLPGRTNGPADAYRHLLWSAELARIYGVSVAKAIISSHEIELFGFNSSTPTEHAIDYHNNSIGFAFGDSLKNSGGTQLDVINWARAQIISGYNLPNEVNINNPTPIFSEGVAWAIPSQWIANPTFIGSNNQAPVTDANWPPIFPNLAAWDDVKKGNNIEWNPLTHSFNYNTPSTPLANTYAIKIPGGVTYSDPYTALLENGGTIDAIVKYENQTNHNNITVQDVLDVNGLSWAMTTKIPVGTSLWVPQKSGDSLIVNAGNVHLSFNQKDKTYTYVISDKTFNTTTTFTRAYDINTGKYLDQYTKIDNATGVPIEKVINLAVNPSYGSSANTPGSVTSTVTTTTTTTAPTVTQTGATNEGAAAAAVQNGIAVSSGVKTVSFSNGELSSTNTYASIIAALTTGGIRPGNFSVMPNGEVTPMPSFMASNPAQNINVTVDAGINPGSYSVSPMGVIMPSIHNSTRTYVDPLILDLNNDGVQLTSYAERTVLFDIDHDGLTAGQTTLEQTGWVKANTSTGQTHNTDGIVVHDLNGNGKIDGIHETLSEFYNGAVGTGGSAGEKKYSNGFTALKSLDTGNGTVGSAGYNDNVFDNKDAAYNQLRVWVDVNADGITDAGELKTLAELNITSINLAATSQSGLVNGGNEILATGSFTQNGQTKQAQAVNFVANTAGNSFTATTDGVRIDTQAGETGQTTSTYTHTGSNSATLSTATLNVKNIYGNTGDDTITGDANANWLGGGTGADSINAGAGDDVILFDADDTSIDGGDGNDIAQVIGESGVTLNLTQSHIEAVVGGRGDDIFIGGGRSSVFITANDGNDIVIGGAANDVLSGENGEDLIDGGAGNDLMRGGRGNDQLMGGSGNDIIEGGQDDDNLNGGDGNDVLTGGQGDDQLDGGLGDNLAEFSGSYADYRVTKVTSNTYRVTDLLGRDGTDTLTNIEKLSFKDISWVDPDLASPLPVKDILDVNSSGLAFNRNSAIQLISKAQLLGNDIDRQSDVLQISKITDLQGGTIVGNYNATSKEWTPTLTANGEVQFIADPNFKGIMGFKYIVAEDISGNITQVSLNGATAAMKAAVYLRTPDIPIDPLAVDQWYLSEANIIPVWQDYTGKGVKIAQFEPGGEFSVGPEILDVTHPDLKPNLDADWISDTSSNIPQTYSNHATMVAGVMVGARNGEGGVGVAYDAEISGHYIQGDGIALSAQTQEIADAMATFKNYDVVNNSWGYKNNFSEYVEPVGSLPPGILEAVNVGRDGLGTIVVQSAGNQRAEGGNTNTNASKANRAVIVVGGINAVSDLGVLQIGGLPFSNPGASILVSAPASNIASTSRLIEAGNGSTFGSSYSDTQGTSFAAPIISGIVALMLEANPNLGWRDVQQILAITAKKVDDPNTDTVWNGADNWNGGGMHTSHDYGFGEVDARAAVRLAETWISVHESDNERHLSSGEGSINGGASLNVAIANGASITRTLAIGAGIRAEHVTVSLDVNHSNWGDLTVELISPSGTVSKLMTNPGTFTGNPSGDVGAGQLTFAFDTTHSYGENAQGNWQLKITDRAGDGTGTLYGWKVDVYGSDFNETLVNRYNVTTNPVISPTADNVYYFTDEFATAPGTNRATINDTNGGQDIINASAVSTGVTINLNNGNPSSISERTFTISGSIEGALGGDGSDTLTGNAEDNSLIGGRGNDYLYGGIAFDYLDGGKGNDVLTGGANSDLFIIRPDATSQDTIVDYSVADGREKIILVGFSGLEDFSQVSKTQLGSDVQLGLPDMQSVLVKNVTLAQLTEQSVMVIPDQKSLLLYMSYKPNAYAVGTEDIQNEQLPNTAGDLSFYAMGGDDRIAADTDNDLVDGGNGNDELYGDYTNTTTGNDWLEGGSGNDFLLGDGGNDLLVGGSGNDGLAGYADNDVLLGNSGSDELYGGDGDDVLDGGTGRDYIVGGTGNDTIYIDNDLGEFDTATNTLYWGMVGGIGADTYVLKKNAGGSVGYNQAGNLVSTSNFIADFNLTDDKIDLSDFKNVSSLSDLNLSQIFSNGTMTITQIVVGAAANAPTVTLRNVSPASLNASNFIFAITTDILGTSGNDDLVGDSGGNVLDGKIGADTMTGRTGNDTYIVDNVGDKVTELAGGGYDAVQSSVTYDLTTLAENVEQLTLTGTAAINGTGNNDANRIVGNSGNNILDGKGGSDDMVGSAGNDTYIVDAGSDRVTENTNEGTDTVQSSVSWTLGKNLENLTLTGFDDVNATGNELVNTLIGNSADNILDGAQGADNLQGGSGNDTYYVDNTGDTITEIAGGGYDTVYSSINISTLNTTSAAQVEQLILAIGATQGTGNALDNVLIGNDVSNTLTGLGGADYLDGGAGIDTLLGGAGNDTYVIDVIKSGTVAVLQDTVTESANEGTDTLQLRTSADLALSAATTLTLATNLENFNISATGSNKLNITGNGAANTLVGNAANNVLLGLVGNDYLDGSLGADSMSGGTEDDTYVVDNIGDVVTEVASQGNDTVISSIAFNLTTASANVENLTLTGFDSINATGNGLVNILIGNAGNNILDGAAGNDQLQGGIGDDTYLIDSGDVITELANQGVDTVKAGFTYTLGNNLENLTVTGSGLFDLTGNSQNNILTGNSATNRLDGGLGNDTLIGGAGNDTYIAGQFVGYYYATWVADGYQYLIHEDVIYEDDGGANDIDTLQLSISYNYPDSFDALRENYRENDDLVISSYTSNPNPYDEQGNYDYVYEDVRINNYFAGEQYQVEKIRFSSGEEILTSSIAYTYNGTDGNDILNILANTTGTYAGNGNDIVYGDNGNNAVYAGSGDDFVLGGAGNDYLRGDAGYDVLQGQDGLDKLYTYDTGLLDGGADNDKLYSSGYDAILIGGAGNDEIYIGSGYQVIAFNQGDGQDIVNAYSNYAEQANDTLSIGGISSYQELSLTHTDNDLIMHVGTQDSITFKNWYLNDNYKNVINLQIITDSISTFDSTLADNQAERFDFMGLVADFDYDIANGATPVWQLMESRLDYHLLTTNSEAESATGGDLAYQYGKNGSLTGMGLTYAKNVLSDANFGQSNQSFSQDNTWQNGSVHLA